jgi:hypothetical protein
MPTQSRGPAARRSADWTLRNGDPMLQSVIDPQGRYLCMMVTENSATQWGWALYVFDTATQRFARIATEPDPQRPTRFNVCPQPRAWQNGQLIIEAWQTPGQPPLLEWIQFLLGRAPEDSMHMERWQYDPNGGSLCRTGPLFVVGGRCFTSADGRYAIVARGDRLQVRDNDTGSVRNTPIVLGLSAAVPDAGLAWLADSQSFLVLDRNGLRQVDRDSGSVLWSQTVEQLETERLGPLGLPGEDSSNSMKPRPGLYGPIRTAHRDGETFFHLMVLRAPSSEHHDGEQENWQLKFPSRDWTRLGVGFKERVTYDATGRFGVEFAEENGETLVIHIDVTSGEKRALFRGAVPPPGSRLFGISLLQILPNPDRVFWIADSWQLWSLRLDGTSVPQKVWSAPDGRR